MRVGFNARYMRDGSLRGFNRYTYSLAKALGRTEGVEVWLLSEEPIHPAFLRDLPARVMAVKAPKHVIWEQVMLPRIIRDLRLNVFHAPATVGLPLWKVCPYVLTIHDVIGIAAADLVGPASPKERAYYWLFQAISLRAASKIITVSEYSKQDISRYLGVPPERIEVIYEAADEYFRVIEDPAVLHEVRERYGIHRPYLLYVGGFDRRKNIRVLIEAYARTEAQADVDLVLVGSKTEEYDRLRDLEEALGLGRRVRFLGYVPDGDLPPLYNGALAFVYPSLYEGFGLQLVEAMACGVPVLASNRTSLPEVVGDAGLLFDPGNLGEVIEAIRAVTGREEIRAELRAKALRRAKVFSWQRTADQTLRVYEELLSHPTGAGVVSR